MNIHRMIPQTNVEGPGRRFAIWTQGCSRHCKGCMLPETWSFAPYNQLPVYQILNKIKKNRMLEGVTILGGEPFEQSEELVELLAGVKKTGLSTIVFTGFLLDEIRAMGDVGRKALKCIDVLIDGEYMESLRSFDIPMIGSRNQRFHFLTNRYCMEDIPPNRIETRIMKDGSVLCNGMGDFQKIKKLWRHEHEL